MYSPRKSDINILFRLLYKIHALCINNQLYYKGKILHIYSKIKKGHYFSSGLTAYLLIVTTATRHTSISSNSNLTRINNWSSFACA